MQALGGTLLSVYEIEHCKILRTEQQWPWLFVMGQSATTYSTLVQRVRASGNFLAQSQ